MINGIFFDVGGTLYSYKNMQASMAVVLQELARKLEHDFAEVARHYQQANRDTDKRYAERQFYLFREYFDDIFDDFLARIGKPHLRHHLEWFEPYQRETLIDCMELHSDCHATLTQLKEMGLYLSAVSNADENHLTPLIERGQLQRWLNHWTSSEAARSCKPDRKFFEIALEKSGLSASEVLFVGDSLEQDIQGAYAVGMKTVLITDSSVSAAPPLHVGRDTPTPDFRITQLQELPAIVAALRR